MERTQSAATIEPSQVPFLPPEDGSGMMGPNNGAGPDIHEAIRQLFDLSRDYILLMDMECVHRRKGKIANTSGHLYIFNKCLAFSGKGMKSIVLPFVKVKAIKKSSSIAARLKGKIKI